MLPDLCTGASGPGDLPIFQAVDDILDAHEKGRRNVAVLYGLKKAHKIAAREVAAAKAAIGFMEVKGERLRQIADFVLSRKH